MMDLPDGLTQRPLRHEDSAAVTDVMAAQELEDAGVVMIDEADIIGDWQKPSFDLASSTVGVFDGDRLVAYAEVSGTDRGDAAVHPDHRGRGIGTALALWMQETARAKGLTTIGMPVPVGSPGEKLLTSMGYRPRWNSWVLALPEGKVIEEQPLADGYTVGEATEDQWPEVHTLLEDAFLEWSRRERETWEDFHAQVVQRPGFEPWNVRVATDPSGEVVGAAIVYVDTLGAGYIPKLGVRRDQRNRGLARALLADSFTVSRAHGARTSELGTDSRTGALSLYEKVGMEVISNWVNLAISL
jgi:GNAT superfamily N-acetyltransferase